MDRAEAIAIITDTLPSLDDEDVQAIADVVRSLAEDDGSTLELTSEQLARIEQSKEDFKAGRTYSLEEMDAYLDAAAVNRGLARAR